MHQTPSHQRLHADRGLTLVELIITIAVLAIVASVLASTASVFLRNERATVERVTESQDLLQITTYLPGDVRSTPSRQIEVATSLPSGCAGGEVGTNMLRLTWNEAVDGITTTHRVSYRIVPGEIPGTAGVDRWYCTGASTAALGPPTVVNMAIRLAADPEPDYGIVQNGEALILTMGLASGRQVRVETGSRNPAATLPPPPGSTLPPVTPPPVTTVPTTTVPPTTTTIPSGTTTVPPGSTTTTATTTTVAAPCQISSVFVQVRTIGGTNARRVSSGPLSGRNRLVYPVDVYLTGWSGACTQLWAQWTPGDPAVVRAPMEPRGESQFTVTVPADLAEKWTTTGWKTLQFFDQATGGSPIATFTNAFQVTNCGGNC